MNARLHLSTLGGGQHVVNKIFVAIDACALRYSPISGLDLNWIVVTAHREGERMKESIVSFRQPLADCIVRQVTVVAYGDMMVTALLPRIHMALHHVTVNARLRVVAEVTGTFAIAERKRAYTRQYAEHNCKYHRSHAKARDYP